MKLSKAMKRGLTVFLEQDPRTSIEMRTVRALEKRGLVEQTSQGFQITDKGRKVAEGKGA